MLFFCMAKILEHNRALNTEHVAIEISHLSRPSTNQAKDARCAPVAQCVGLYQVYTTPKDIPCLHMFTSNLRETSLSSQAA